MSNIIKFQKLGKKRAFPAWVPLVLGAFAIGAGAGTYFLDAGIPAVAYAQQAAPAVIFHRCGSERMNCIVDGDTLWMNGVKIRVADIDTPEISQPKCVAERALGERATARLVELVNAGRFEVRAFGSRDEDQYGRKLRVLTRNGRSLGDVLVSEGLARTWSGRREPWC